MNNSEMFNREKKAAKLAKFLFSIGVTAEHVLSATEDDWKWIAMETTKKYGEPTNPPNKDNPKPTIDAIIAMLTRMYVDAECDGPDGPKTAQQESDEAAAADEKAEGEWLEKQMMETGNERTPRI